MYQPTIGFTSVVAGLTMPTGRLLDDVVQHHHVLHVHHRLAVHRFDEWILVQLPLARLICAVHGTILQARDTHWYNEWIGTRALLTLTKSRCPLWLLSPMPPLAPYALPLGGTIDWWRDDRLRSFCSLVPSRSPCDVYEMRDWCDVYDECLEPDFTVNHTSSRVCQHFKSKDL